MDTKILTKIIKALLDDGDNDMLDGITGIEKVARAIADALPAKEGAAFLRSVRLSKIKS